MGLFPIHESAGLSHAVGWSPKVCSVWWLVRSHGAGFEGAKNVPLPQDVSAVYL